MKHLPQKLLGLFCSLLLLILLLPSAAGVDIMYNMSVNDKFLDYTTNSTPIVVNGTVYIPYQVLIAEYNNGVQLGIFYGTNEDINTLSLYSKQQPILTFYIDSGTTYDANGNTHPFRAIARNGTTYVPADDVCDYFGLQYSFLPNDYGVLIRIKQDGAFYLSDRMFLSSATSKFKEQKQVFDRIQAEAAIPTSPAPSSPNSSDTSRIQVSFAFRCDGAEGPDSLLDVLSDSDVRGLFLFRPDDLSYWDDSIRRLLAEGHRIGFLVDGATAGDCQLQAQQGNQLLAHIARTKTDFLLVDGASSLTDELRAEGWVCWKGNITGIPTDDIRPASLSANIILNVEAKRSYARILMDNSETAVSALDRLLPQLERGGYAFRTITETDLT